MGGIFCYLRRAKCKSVLAQRFTFGDRVITEKERSGFEVIAGRGDRGGVTLLDLQRNRKMSLYVPHKDSCRVLWW